MMSRLAGLLVGLCVAVQTGSNAGISKPSITGVVIDHVPATSKTYIGSPSIAILQNGCYVASHDFFGGGSSSDTTAVFGSFDRGRSWHETAVIKGQWWSTLFVRNNELYLLGTSKEFGRIVIRRSTDGGVTWTSPAAAASGQLTSAEHYHCAPTPVIEHNGRIWRAFEDINPSPDGGKSFQAFVISAPMNADLLSARNWAFSSAVPGKSNWLGGKFGGWLEGNVVVDRDGDVLDILRVRFTAGPEKAAYVRISSDGSSATFDPSSGFHDFPGGAKKFTIRFDRETQLYWTLANTVPEPKPPGRIDLIRNTLALASSPDLIHWTKRAILLHHPDAKYHAFQYADWQFEGDDIVAVVRTAGDDQSGGAHSGHDANYLTFLRVHQFRDFKMVLPESPPSFETFDFSISGNGFTIDTLANGEAAFSNRNYVWQGIPASYVGWQYTKIAGGSRPTITIRAKHEAVLQMITGRDQPAANLAGWKPTGISFDYTDNHHTRMALHTKRVAAGDEIIVPQESWTGGLLLWPDSKK